MVRIVELRLKNFRSFGPGPEGQGSRLVFRGRLTPLAGENNSGKSNILAALKLGPSFAAGLNPSGEDYNRRRMENELGIGIELVWDKVDVPDLQSALQLRSPRIQRTVDFALRSTLLRCGFNIRYVHGQRSVIWRVGPTNVWNQYLLFHPVDPRKGIDGHRSLSFEELIEDLQPSSKRVSMKSLVVAKGLDPSLVAIQFPADIGTALAGVLLGRVAVFEEVRFRPAGRGGPILESYDGSRVADMLFALKNGSSVQRERWEAIRVKFGEIFPQLELEVTGTTQAPQITVIDREGFELPVERIGAGIGQVITLLANTVGSEGRLFALDVPESHLHPHALRTLLGFLGDVAESNQVVIATHSPLVCRGDDLLNAIVVRWQRNGTTVHQLPVEAFSDVELQKLASRMGPENREFMFSRKAVLVEGDTELGALPILAHQVRQDLDRLGISLVGLGGKHFSILMKAADALGIPCAAVCDRDALMNVETTWRTNGASVRTSPVFSQLGAMGQLSPAEIKMIRNVMPRRTNAAGRSLVYPAKWFPRLSAIAEVHRIFVWEADFDQILRAALPRAMYLELIRETPSKVIQGRLLAQQIVAKNRVPKSLAARLRKIFSV